MIPHGWNIERKDAGPFKRIHIIAPNNFTAVVESHARNPENVLYMLADSLLRRTDAECEAGHAPDGKCEFGPYGWRGVIACKHCLQAPPDGVSVPPPTPVRADEHDASTAAEFAALLTALEAAVFASGGDPTHPDVVKARDAVRAAAGVTACDPAQPCAHPIACSGHDKCVRADGGGQG